MLTHLLAPLHSQEKRKVIEAIHSFGFKVVPEEISLREGMPLAVVTTNLNQIATETGGNFRVSDQGTIQYIFEPHFETQYIVNGARNTWQAVFRIISNIVVSSAKLLHLILMTLFRISIGLIMIASVILVIVLIVVALLRILSAVNSDGDGVDVGDVGGGLGGIEHAMGGIFMFIRYFIVDWIFDWWFWRHSYFSPWRGYGWGWGRGYNDPWYYDPGGPRYYYDDNYWVDPFFSKDDKKDEETKEEKEKKEKGPDFLMICYEFVFGPEDPNKNIVDKYWKCLAAVIRNNGGVVTAEQLAPYTGKDEPNEDWMLPILTRFEGAPEVTDTGNIVYVFPKFAATFQGMRYDTMSDAQPNVAEQANSIDPVKPETINVDQLRALYTNSVKRQPTVQRAKQKVTVPNYLEEELHSFVDFDMAKLTPAVLMGLIEVSGSIYLFTLLNTYSFLADFKPLIIFLLAYGVLFFTIPALRAVLLAAKNTATQARNESRFELYSKISSPSPELKQKLLEASGIRNSVAASRPTTETEVYTTEKDWLEQQRF